MKRLLCALALLCVMATAAAALLLGSVEITSVFDTTRNSTGKSVYSNGNATVTGGAGLTACCIAAFTNVVHVSGKYAFRFTENVCTTSGAQNCAVGLGTASALDNTYLSNGTTSVGINDGGVIAIGNVVISTGGPTFAPGNTIDVEADLDGKTISYSVNGGAFSTPVSIASLTNFLLSPAVTMNAATDAFTYTGHVSFPGFSPWDSVPAPAISSVSLSNSTFTPNTANGAVGTVSVAMNTGAAFTGSLSITGANTGGFHLSGTALQQAGGGGTAAGTYSDLNIVATQAGISNSPQQISPSLVGGAVPQPAQVAGFNTLIINDNFQSATFANTATWLDCNDQVTTPPASPLYYAAWSGFSTFEAPCTAVSQATDTAVGGQLALKLHWEDSYINRSVLGGGPNPNTVGVSLTSSANNGSPAGRLIPRGFYLEVVARTDFNAGGASGHPWMDLWSYVPNSIGSYEIDGFEESGPGGGFAIHNPGADPVNQNCPGSYCSCADANVACAGASLDLSQYHTFAWRQTSAGSDIIFCAYVDGTKYGNCNTVAPSSSQLSANSQMATFLQNSNSSTPMGNGSTGKNVWVKSLKIWSCAGPNSSNACNSSSNNP